MVEGGVETRDLRQLRPQFREGADRLQATRLVQRSQRRQAIDLGLHVAVDADRTVEGAAAVHDPMPDRAQFVAAKMGVNPAQHSPEHVLMGGTFWPGSFGQSHVVRPLGGKARL